MGMCAIRGPLVTSSPGEDDGDATPKSTMSSTSYGSSSSQELEAGELVNQYDHNVALWKRTIPKGRRCRPLSFSGVILYDESGKQIASWREAPEDRPEEFH